MKRKRIQLRLGIAFAAVLAILVGVGQFGLNRMKEGDGGEAGDGSEAGAEAETGSRTVVAEAAVNFVVTYGAAGSRALSKQGGGLSRHGSRSKFSGRSTICISSQVGCAVDCQFCLTALLGVKRNLTAGEIVGQVCAVLKDQGVSPPLP